MADQGEFIPLHYVSVADGAFHQIDLQLGAFLNEYDFANSVLLAMCGQDLNPFQEQHMDENMPFLRIDVQIRAITDHGLIGLSHVPWSEFQTQARAIFSWAVPVINLDDFERHYQLNMD